MSGTNDMGLGTEIPVIAEEWHVTPGFCVLASSIEPVGFQWLLELCNFETPGCAEIARHLS